MFIDRFLHFIRKSGLVLTLSIVIASLVNSTPHYFPFASSSVFQLGQQEIRGVWVPPWSITTKVKVDQVLQTVEAAGFNTVFVCIFYEGQTLYPSSLANTHRIVEPGFDPLAYLMDKVEHQKIEVHAWFVAGKVSEGTETPLLSEHPDWGLIGPDGGSIAWLNFTRPDVRQFVTDLAVEVLERYDVDGVHLDYIRYPDPEWGFDPYSIEAFRNEYGLDANQLRYEELPAYGMFTANPLTSPTSAQVLATFENGYPAITLNQHGEGEVVLFNWQANERRVAISSEVMQRSIQHLLQPGGTIYLLRSETNAKSYGYNGVNQTKAWLEFLGWEAEEVSEADVDTLTQESVLVMPNIYLITSETATQLSNFVQQGGGVIFIDGPTLSIHRPKIQEITGMQARGTYFKEQQMMLPNGEHELIPTSGREACLEYFQTLDALWKDFRRKGVTLTVQELHHRVKSSFPQVKVSAVIPSNPNTARQQYMQDWLTWLQTGSIDILNPLVYVDQPEELGSLLEDWRPALNEDIRVAFGLISYTGKGESRSPKPAKQLISEIEMTRQLGVNDFVIFELNFISDEQIVALKEDSKTRPAIGPNQSYLPFLTHGLIPEMKR